MKYASAGKSEGLKRDEVGLMSRTAAGGIRGKDDSCLNELYSFIFWLIQVLPGFIDSCIFFIVS